MQVKYLSDIRIEELRKFAVKFVAAEPDRLGSAGFWQKPLMVSAPIDERFDILPQIAFNEHLHPHDLLPTARSLIVFFIPFKRESDLPESTYVCGKCAALMPCSFLNPVAKL
jgi:hypothetical protein